MLRKSGKLEYEYEARLLYCLLEKNKLASSVDKLLEDSHWCQCRKSLTFDRLCSSFHLRSLPVLVLKSACENLAHDAFEAFQKNKKKQTKSKCRVAAMEPVDWLLL